MRAAPVFARITVLALLATAAAAQQPSGSKPVASVPELMKSVVIPESNAVFGVGKEAPKNDQDWTGVQDSAAKLADTAQLLMLQAPATGSANWVNYSKAMADAATTAGRAAQAKNVDAVLDAGDVLYSSCVDCHKQYLRK